MVEKRVGLAKKPKEHKNNYLFDIINDIKWHKKGNLLDIEEYEKAFNNFIVMRMLAQNNDTCEMINMINEYQQTLSKKQLYKLLIELVPKAKTFDGFVKSVSREDDENIKYVSLFYECSLKEAREYINILGSTWAREIRNRFGGKQQ
jgi:hypothetical protein